MDFEVLRRAGFNGVRIPFKALNHLNDQGVLNPEFLRRLKEVIRVARSNGLVTILDLHDQELSSGQGDYAARLLQIWSQVLLATRELSNDGVCYELLNEPHGRHEPSLWVADQQQLIESLRALGHGDVNFVLTSAPWSSADSLRVFRRVRPTPKTAYTVHFYEPFQFTHQGAYWVKGAEKWRGKGFEDTAIARAAVSRYLDGVDRILSNDIPLFVGEFGVHRRVADANSSRAWVRTALAAFEHRKLSWFYWSFTGDFGIYDEQRLCWDPILLELLPSTKASVCD